MIPALIGLLFFFLILAVVFYIIRVAVGYFHGPDFVVQIAGLVLLLIFLARLLHVFGVDVGLGR